MRIIVPLLLLLSRVCSTDGSETNTNATNAPSPVPSPSLTAATVAPTAKDIDLPLADFNLLVVTDVHSWVAGHSLHEDFDADYGDVLSFYRQVKQYCDSHGNDLWFAMNGDILHGTLLGRDPPDALIPILSRMPWDIVNIGEHEMEYNETVSQLRRIGGYTDLWGPGLLSSNTIVNATGEPFGNRYTFLNGKRGTLLVFGFLYNVRPGETSSLVTVERVEEAIESDWFTNVLAPKNFDGIVVMAHMDVDDKLIHKIHSKIRSICTDSMPVHFLAGHTHQRGFKVLDDYATSLEAGRFLDTVGFLSFSQTPRNHNHRFIPATKADFSNILGRTDWKTSEGFSLSNFIGRVRHSLGATEVIGCAPRTYRSMGLLNESDSLLRLYAKEVIPTQFLLPHEDNKDNNVMLQSINFFTHYNLYKGNITMDDVYAAFPEDDVIYKVAASLRGDKLKRLTGYVADHATILNGTTSRSIAITADDRPIKEGTIRYELFAPARDAALIWPKLDGMRVRHPKHELLFNGEKTLRGLIIDFIKSRWNNFPCNQTVQEEELEREKEEEKREADVEAGKYDDIEDEGTSGSRLPVGYLVAVAIGVAFFVLAARFWVNRRTKKRVRLESHVGENFEDDAILAMEDNEHSIKIS